MEKHDHFKVYFQRDSSPCRAFLSPKENKIVWLSIIDRDLAISGFLIADSKAFGYRSFSMPTNSSRRRTVELFTDIVEFLL